MKRADRILVLAPHPDDGELGVGASMARWAGAGAEVTILMLSDRGEPQWMGEALRAAAALGERVSVETLHLTTFHMHTERASLLKHLEQYRDNLKPDIVFAPARNTHHQDHACCFKEARRCFKGVTLLCYEIIRSDFRFRPTLFIPVSGKDVERKVNSVQAYRSQRDKLYCQMETIEGLARVRGAQCDSSTGLAEAFEVEWAVLGI